MKIPKGWRKVKAGELQREGDKRFNEDGEWSLITIIGLEIKAGWNTRIRKIKK